MTDGPSINYDMKAAFSGAKWAYKAHEAMMRTLRKVFTVATYDEGGLCDNEVLDLLAHFLAYCDRVRKVFEVISDNVDGNIAIYMTTYASLWRRLIRPKPTYLEHFGFWLNRKRSQYRKSYAVAFGAGVALGTIEPGMDYYRAITDGEGEALLLKAKVEMANRRGSDDA